MFITSFILNQLLVSDGTDRHPVRNETKLCKHSQMAALRNGSLLEVSSHLGLFPGHCRFMLALGKRGEANQPVGISLIVQSALSRLWM